MRRLPQKGWAGSFVTGTNFSPGTGKNSTPSEANPILPDEKSGLPFGRWGGGGAGGSVGRLTETSPVHKGRSDALASPALQAATSVTPMILPMILDGMPFIV